MINHEDVRKIAGLAKLEISANALDKFTEQMNQILGFIENLNKLDTKNIEPTSHALGLASAFRKDEVQESRIQAQVFEGAPRQEENLFMVPKVIG
ncbi:MAG: Asp-tRNA(Asn)/Glu-tRNA(Gln) amidotransferase subunit GatC [Deltaproteobacteria bacterium]|nr:Asp-tRNA(Asn)/Glu-tRNA(Gln) amidotransferase subunit GatC [Deltaproteobacteria bacterium]